MTKSSSEKSSVKSTRKAKSAGGKGNVKSSSTSSKKLTKSKSSSGSKSIKLKSYKSLQKSIKMPSPHTVRNNQVVPKFTSGSTEKSNKSGKSKEKLAKDVAGAVNLSVGIESAKQVHSNIEKQTPSAEQPKSVPPSKSGEWDGKSSLSTKISKSFRSGQNSESVKLKLKTSDPKSIANDHGSVFTSNVQNDDSALALVMHTARDTEVKRDETEIFVPGKGELRSTQPDQP